MSQRTVLIAAVVLVALGSLVLGPRSPVAGAQSSSLVWDKPETITRKPKPTRHYSHPKPKVERKPLLTLEWRVLKRGADNQSIEINPVSPLSTGDRIRLALRTNQAGYLYVINETENAEGQIVEAPRIIFPDSRADNGQNYTKKDQEYILPIDCPGIADKDDCWFRMNDTTGREVLIIIFSRDLVTDLPSEVDASGHVNQSYIEQLKADSQRNLKRTSNPGLSAQKGGAGRYVIWVTNTSRDDNEQIVESVALIHNAD